MVSRFKAGFQNHTKSDIYAILTGTIPKKTDGFRSFRTFGMFLHMHGKSCQSHLRKNHEIYTPGNYRLKAIAHLQTIGVFIFPDLIQRN